MSNLLSGLFGKPSDIKAIYQNGAVILDVRTPEEFRAAHMDGAINIPVDHHLLPERRPKRYSQGNLISGRFGSV